MKDALVLQYFMFCSLICYTIYPLLKSMFHQKERILQTVELSEYIHFPFFLSCRLESMLVIVGSILSYFFLRLGFGAMCVTYITITSVGLCRAHGRSSSVVLFSPVLLYTQSMLFVLSSREEARS